MAPILFGKNAQRQLLPDVLELGLDTVRGGMAVEGLFLGKHGVSSGD